MLGPSVVAVFVRDAAWATFSLGQIMGNLMNGAHVRLPKPSKEEKLATVDPGDDLNVIRFPGEIAEKRVGA